MFVKVRPIEIDTTYQSKSKYRKNQNKDIMDFKKIYDAMIKREKLEIVDSLSKDILKELEFETKKLT